MKSLYLIISLLALPASSLADCQLTASQQNISYGRISASERQLANDHVLTLPEKKIVINVVCDEPQRMRLVIGSTLSGGSKFTLGDGGEMQVIAASAYVDDRPVRIASVQSADDTPASGGQEQQEITPNQGMAFINGTEMRGQTVSVTLMVHSRLKPAVISEQTTWRGNLNIKLEAL